MDKIHPLSTPMVVLSLEVTKDTFRPPKENEKIIGPKVPYFSVIGALMYVANVIGLDRDFHVNLLSRYSFSLTRRYRNGVKHILRCLKGTIDTVCFILTNIL